MKFKVLHFLIFLALCPQLSARVEPPLPTWDAEEKKMMEEEGWFAGRLLLTDEPIEEDSQLQEPTPLDVEAPTSEELAEPEPLSSEIAEEYLLAYFEKRPESFILDPQGLLSSKEANDRLSFLKYHAKDSTIDLYIYLFKADQEIPGEVREEEIIERFFSEGKPAAVVYYFLGAPQRSIFYLSPSLTDAVSAAEQRRALQSSVIQAFQSAVASDQFEAFLVQMSIRIYWMERMLGAAKAAPDEVTSAVMTPQSKSVPLPMVTLSDRFSPWVPHAILLVVIPLVAFAFRFWLRSRARFSFPDFEVEPRLGGGHAAGVGAVISFANAALPPASQRDQVPDYLRRA